MEEWRGEEEWIRRSETLGSSFWGSVTALLYFNLLWARVKGFVVAFF